MKMLHNDNENIAQQGIKKFFAIARERYQILLNRRAGLPRDEWTKDPIFKTNRFCNVFREDDKTTEWFRDNIRDAYRNDPEMALGSIVTFRWFNKIEVGHIIKLAFEAECSFDALKAMIFQARENKTIVTGAYIIKTPDGMNKLDGVIWCLKEFQEKFEKGDFDKILSGKATMKEACKLLQTSPFLGRFMAYQICADTQHTCLLENASDIMNWAQPGPGSTRGISRIFYNDVNKFKYGSVKDEQQVISHMQQLLSYSKDPTQWPKKWPQWDMQTVQNWCCEYSKHEVAQEGGHMKRKYI